MRNHGDRTIGTVNIKKATTAFFRVAGTNARLAAGKVVHGSKLKYHPVTCLAFNDDIMFSKEASVDFGQGLRTRGRCGFNVQEHGKLTFGKDVFLNLGCQFNCHASMRIEDGCEFGPYVLVYDHDHDFRSGGGIKDKAFSYGNVEIGKNCWIGAHTIILKGTRLGEGCVVAAGSVLRGDYPPHSIIVQKRTTDVRPIERSAS